MPAPSRCWCRRSSPARFTCGRLTFGEGGGQPIENLYARVGEGPPHLCFAGHTDVVPPGDAKLWTHPPFAANVLGGVLYGRGAADMKGAIACFVAAALDYVKSRGREIDGSISLLITGDEEGPAINGTRKVLDWMAEEGRAAGPLPGRRADQLHAPRRSDQDRAARQPQWPAQGDRRARPRRLSASCQQSDQGPHHDAGAPTTTRRSITAARISRRPISR